GTVLDRQGLPDQAIEQYRRAAQDRPELAFIRYNLALTLHRRLHFLAAAQEYRTAIRLGMDDVTIHSNLALSLHRARKYPEAAQEYEIALGHDPKSAFLHYSLGVLHEWNDRIPEAIEHYQQAVNLLPEWSGAHNELGHAWQQLGRWDEAVAEYREIFRLDPKNVWAHNNLATLMLRTRRPLPEGERLAEEVRRFEDAAVLPNADPGVITFRDRCRRDFLPHLASYSSVDWRIDAESEILSARNPWRIFRGVSEPAGELPWTDPQFDDSSWEPAPRDIDASEDHETVGLVFEDADPSYSTVYLRARFDVPDPASCNKLRVSLQVIDGCVVYVNGTEVGRVFADPRGEALPFDATGRKEWTPWTERRIEVEPASLLLPAGNVVAVQVVSNEPAGRKIRCAISMSALLAFERGGRELAEKDLAAYRAIASGRAAEARIAYFEARLAQESGDLDAAEKMFREVLAADPERPEPVIRIAQCRRARGDSAGAAKVLLDAIASGLEGFDILWDEWIQTAFAELHREPSDLLDDLPDLSLAPREHAADIVWLLGRLAAGEPLRIRCGGEGVVLEGRGVWSRDRFYLGGRAYQLTEMEALPRDPPEIVLCTTERYFIAPAGWADGYRIPLPPDEYIVTLWFAEGHFKERGERVFDVFLEGDCVLPEYEPLQGVFGKPDAQTRRVEVKDGALNIDFRCRIENPKISAFEIHRG
ncbi:MAG: tetratricopeptide repeat protein, partial [Planctomycetes bacterium]|nr:tetratricopeptide repeat protein [Planctomycetota bacterium]